MNGEHRSINEPQSHGVASFVEVAERMHPSDSLLLSRNRAQIVGTYGVGYEIALHYEGLNPVSTPLRPGKKINEEFYEAAYRIKVQERTKAAGLAYPTLSVTNYQQELTVSKVVDIADLLLSGRDDVEIHTSPSEQSSKFEVITVEIDGLARRMAYAARVGVEPTLVIGPQMGEPMGEALPVEMMAFRGYFIDRQTGLCLRDVDPRGETVLGLLQLGVADAFRRNSNRVNPGKENDLEVGLYVETFPDLQARVLELIDFADCHGYRLGCEKRDMGNKRWEYEFSLYHDWADDRGGNGRPEHLQQLAIHPSLRIAAYRAYLAAKQNFPHSPQL